METYHAAKPIQETEISRGKYDWHCITSHLGKRNMGFACVKLSIDRLPENAFMKCVSSHFHLNLGIDVFPLMYCNNEREHVMLMVIISIFCENKRIMTGSDEKTTTLFSSFLYLVTSSSYCR